MTTATVLHLHPNDRSNATELTEELVLECVENAVQKIGLLRFANAMTFASEAHEAAERLAA